MIKLFFFYLLDDRWNHDKRTLPLLTIFVIMRKSSLPPPSFLRRMFDYRNKIQIMYNLHLKRKLSTAQIRPPWIFVTLLPFYFQRTIRQNNQNSTKLNSVCCCCGHGKKTLSMNVMDKLWEHVKIQENNDIAEQQNSIMYDLISPCLPISVFLEFQMAFMMANIEDNR